MTLTAAACGGGGSSKQPPGGGMPTMKLVGPSGGAVSSSDGNLAVNIPAGALPADVTITTEPAAAPATGAVGTVYEIGPTGTQFAMPVTLTLHYDAAALNGAAASSLRVATFAGGAWQLLPGAVVDTQAKTVSGVTTHLSPYAVVTEEVGKTCATVQTAFGCTDTGTPGVDASAGGGTKPPADGTMAAACEVPTCAAATYVCSQYPGATMDSCVDSATGYSAACCFPSNAPICFAIGGASAGCDTATGPNGAPAGGSTCPPPPTCATAAMACAGYPGATLQNCKDTANGFTGACCFAPSAPVCVKTGAGRACADGPAGTTGGANCPPPPRCSDGNPCANYVGATASSCTDTADGFEATCCFAGGTLPVTRGGGSGPSGTADGGVPAADAGMGGGTGGAGGMTGGGACAAGAACTAGYRCGGADSSGACMDCMCGANGTLVCSPCDKPDGGGAGATTGTGGAGAGAGGMTGGGTCVAGAACTPGSRCGGADSSGACTDCACGANGTLMCSPCAGKPDAGGTTGTGGAGGMTGGGTCAAGDACTPGFRCGGADSSGMCMECICGADGMLSCVPCGTKPDAGGTGGTGGTGGMTGGTCTAGDACAAGFRCSGPSPTGMCMDCMCGADGMLACAPCGGTKPDGGTGGMTGGTCVAGDACAPNFRCSAPGPTGMCMDCMCGADGTLACGPCGGGTGGTTGTGGTGGPVTGPCQVMPMPAAQPGQPCGVMEVCPDGTDYRVRCDGTSGACTCFLKGVPAAAMPTMSCTGFDPSAALVACGFPDGKI
ncbi:MAG TPA: hypothetical protein VN903_27430 [Polyangia bacterium]|nr:hypothetical protein [Polyangia bacterium]